MSRTTGRRKLIAIDIDNTFADYTGALREYVKLHIDLEHRYELPAPSRYDFRCEGWPFRDSLSFSFQATHKAAVRHGLHLKEHPMPHAVDSVKQLSADYDVLFITSRTDDDGDTRRWLNSVINGRYWVGLCHTITKHRLHADLYIEDQPYALNTLLRNDAKILCPAHPYNESERRQVERMGKGCTFDDWQKVPELARLLIG